MDNAACREPGSVLEDVFGYSSFRKGQRDVVDTIVNGEDAFVLMPTGGGKSLCFQVPALCRPGLAIVVSPLISLMQDQVATLKAKGVCADYIASGQSRNEHLRILKDIKEKRTQLLYVAPERLKLDRFLSFLKTQDVSLFAIDEAHCVSQWGHDFRSSYQELGPVLAEFPDVPKVACTATADPVTVADIVQSLGIDNARHFTGSFDRENISISFRDGGDDTLASVVEYLAEREGQTGIIYRTSRKKVDETVIELLSRGVNAVGYHAGMSGADRTRIQERFANEEAITVVATISFGMGIDRSDVRYVVHMDVPATLEGYYQEIGRAGRDGEPSEACLFFTQKSVGRLKQQVEAKSDVTDERKAVLRSKAEHVIALVETPGCRRATLLRYFGEELSGECGNCDRCRSHPKFKEGTEQAKTVVRAILETDQRFGLKTLSTILSPDSKLDADVRSDKKALTCFGSGRNLSQESWRNVMRQMIGLGLLDIDPDRFGALSVRTAGRELLTRGTRVKLTGDWVDIAPRIEVTEHRTLSEGRRDRLPATLKEIYDGLLDMLSSELENGDVEHRELVSLLERRPNDADDIVTLTENMVLKERAQELANRFLGPSEDAVGAFEIEL